MFGPEMFELTKYLQAEQLRAAEVRRSVNRSTVEGLHDAQRHKEPRGSWTLEWASNGFTGAQVTLINEATGRRATGRHPFDWDQALASALEERGLLA